MLVGPKLDFSGRKVYVQAKREKKERYENSEETMRIMWAY